MAQQERMMGNVLWFNDIKGYGFIKPKHGCNDVFVHQSSIRSEGFPSLAEGEEVEFSLSLEPGGKLCAVDVTGPNGSNVKRGSIDGQGGGPRGGRGSFGRTWSGNSDRYGRGPVGSANGGGCFTCGEVGHLAIECPRSRTYRGANSIGNPGGGACFRCGGMGHMARDCNRNINGGGQACFNCGGYGHMARDCTSRVAKPDLGGGPCYSCNKTGHIARDCPNRPSSPGKPRTSCFHCGEQGHFARECRN